MFSIQTHQFYQWPMEEKCEISISPDEQTPCQEVMHGEAEQF
jgi:hypothetical protein